MKKYFIPAFILSIFTLPATAENVGSGFDVSANAALSTDYIWRGVSQTRGHPAISGGFDVSHESGLYIGTWGSNVDFGDSTSLELDGYGGVSNELFGSGVSYDIGAIGYIYPGESYDFYEIYAGLSGEFGPISPSVKAYYNPDYKAFNEDFYVDSGLDISLPADVTLSGHYGATIKHEGDYTNDYLVGVSRPFVGLDFGVMYTYSNDDTGRVVGTVSKSF